MADATTEPLETTSEETAKTIEAPGAENTETSTAKEGEVDKTFTQADLDRILKERLDKAQKAADKKAEDARAEAERKAAEEQGEFKTLYETEKANREAAESRATQVERERMIDRIAAKHALPDDLRDRLRGESEEELDSDAEKLAGLLTKPQAPKAPDIDADKRGKSGTGEMTEAEQAALRQRFRI